MKKPWMLRTFSVFVGIVVALALVPATRPPCLSDPPACGSYITIGSGCSTYTNPSPPFYPECCQYWTHKCLGSSVTWTQRSGWIFGEACTNINTGKFICPSQIPL
jgi:hypothetical protein